jgi:hypothetical protein
MAEDPGGRFERAGGYPDTPAEATPPAPALPEWVERLPEQYRENPAGYFDHVAEIERRAQEADTWREYGTQAREYIEWQRGQLERQPRGTAPATPRDPEPPPAVRWTPPPNPLENADWDDPATLPRLMQTMWDAFARQAEENFQRHQLTAEQMEARTQAMQGILGNWDRINRLETEAFYRHHNWTPPVSRQQVVEYMREHGGDADTAFQALTEQARIEEARRQGMEEGRREAERERANLAVTTEVSRGTPPRRPPVETNPERGYGNRGDRFRNFIAERTGQVI